ncbi:mechanosensitive ion channel protein 10 isoform X1 [Beta vulgaris subsp. vulgaris]|uniref:mechanosensitive ion channel protein 10 isoform X1 n=1 Tax=Beta vulgaris subsp. vulgaris TaxID=3555 RepID=UPI002036C79E|nr:mechanosensitive ion channel protein 10 isoform X1 [Beta vulgaris subsp. vulgaris]
MEIDCGDSHSGDEVFVFLSDSHTQGNQSLPSGHPNTNTIDRQDLKKPRLLSGKTLRKRTPLHRLTLSKPKSRNNKFNLRSKINVTDQFDMDQTILEEDMNDINNNNSIGPFSSLDFSSPSSSEEKEEEKIGSQKYHTCKKKKRKIKWRRVGEWSLFFVIVTCLVLSLTLPFLRHRPTWGLVPWQWCLMVMVVFSGRLCSGWLVSFLVFVIERNFMLREKVLYFVYGLRKSIQSVIWLALVLLAWTCMFNARVHRNNKVVKKVSHLLVAVLAGAIIWLTKIVLVKTLASSFHVRTYFDRMKESVFHHYILDTLSGPPSDQLLWEEHETIKRSTSLPTRWKDAKNAIRSKKYGSRKLDMEDLRKLSMENPTSIWTLRRLINHIRASGLSPISKTVDEYGKAESEITSELQARTTAKRIFKHVAKRGAKYIEEEDLARFLKRVEIHVILPLFEGAIETRRITRSSFRNWVVRAYFERKALAHSLNDTKTAVQQLHKIASAIVSVIIFVVFLMMMGLATPRVVAFIITQMVVLGVIFHNTCKIVFDCIMFVFVMHPFDIGDRCKIDGVQMIVEEMNILTTVFLRYDMEKIYYPNAALLTKPISNFYRSPEMWDKIPFSIDASTPIETINALKKAIQSYIDSKPNYWNSKHNFIVQEIENLKNMKMALSVQHTINHQNYTERSMRLTELILELKEIIRTLGIKNHHLPQEIHLIRFDINNTAL